MVVRAGEDLRSAGSLRVEAIYALGQLAGASASIMSAWVAMMMRAPVDGRSDGQSPT